MESSYRQLWELAGGLVPNHWVFYSIESLLKDSKAITVGVMYPGGNVNDGVPLVRVADVKNGVLLEKPSYLISDEVNSKYKKTQLDGSELLITLVGNPGDCVVVNEDMKGWNVARALAVLRLKDPSLREWLRFILLSSPAQHQISSRLNTTVQKTLNLKDIKEIAVPIPPLSERLSITTSLKILNDKIELNRQMNETLEAMAQALFKSWFVDFDPVIDNALLKGKAIPEPLKERAELCQAQLDSGKAKTNSEINDLFPSEFEFTEELGWIPKGWKVSSLEDLANISSSKRIFAKEYLTEGIPFYRGKEISLLSKGEDVSSEIYISQDRFMELKDKFGVPKEGDILLTSVGTLGNAYLVNSEDEFYFKDGNLTWFKDYKTLIKGEYLYYWLKSREAKLAIDNITIGSTQQALTISSLNGIKIVKPNDSAIKIFNESIIPIIVKSVHLKKNRVTLAKLRDTLLPKLMSGELRIADTEKLAENI